MAFLAKQEKVKVRHHLGYLNVQDAQTFVLGTPASVETQFIIEGAMDRILEEAVPEVRRHLQILDGLEDQMVNNHELMQIQKIDTIVVNSTGAHREQKELRKAYDDWVDSLANLFGVIRNPFDKRLRNYGRSINTRVG